MTTTDKVIEKAKAKLPEHLREHFLTLIREGILAYNNVVEIVYYSKALLEIIEELKQHNEPIDKYVYLLYYICLFTNDETVMYNFYSLLYTLSKIEFIKYAKRNFLMALKAIVNHYKQDFLDAVLVASIIIFISILIIK